MISRPTTDQLLRACAQELIEQVLPAVQDETAAVRLHMLATVVHNAAVRSAHEIAWMHEEAADAVAYGRAVHLAGPDDELGALLAAPDAVAPTSLHLEDVVAAYTRAGDVLARAIEVAADAGAADLLARGEQLLDQRLAHEKQVMSTYAIVGR